MTQRSQTRSRRIPRERATASESPQNASQGFKTEGAKTESEPSTKRARNEPTPPNMDRAVQNMDEIKADAKRSQAHNFTPTAQIHDFASSEQNASSKNATMACLPSMSQAQAGKLSMQAATKMEETEVPIEMMEGAFAEVPKPEKYAHRIASNAVGTAAMAQEQADFILAKRLQAEEQAMQDDHFCRHEAALSAPSLRKANAIHDDLVVISANNDSSKWSSNE